MNRRERQDRVVKRQRRLRAAVVAGVALLLDGDRLRRGRLNERLGHRNAAAEPQKDEQQEAGPQAHRRGGRPE